MSTLRERNKETILKYLSLSGPDRVKEIPALFTENGMVDPPPQFSQSIPTYCRFEKWLEIIARELPEWEWKEPTIYECDNPRKFLVKTAGVGKRCEADGKMTSIEWYMTLDFEMENGKIFIYREIMDLMEKLQKNNPRFAPQADDPVLRKQNKQGVEEYLATGGPKRHLDRIPMFTDDGLVQGPPFIGVGIFKYKDFNGEPKDIPGYAMYDTEIYECDDPNKFIARLIGRGFSDKFDKHGTVIGYVNYFVHTFEMDHGKIKLVRETVNGCDRVHRENMRIFPVEISYRRNIVGY